MVLDLVPMSPEQIKNLSVFNITKTQLYDSNGEPTIGGLFDPKMGYIEPVKDARRVSKHLLLALVQDILN